MVTMPVHENGGKYLLARLDENYSLKLILATINEIASRCQQDGLARALADLRAMEGNPTIMDRYEMGEEVARVLGSEIQTAAVAKPGMINWLGETVAVNRGLKLKVFAEMELALKWLKVEE